MSKALLEFKNISKAFGEVSANKNISFSVRQGSIHALIGENGAGKSTLMKILFGLYKADQGQIIFNGKETNIQSPIAAKNLGIGMVHQHFMLAGPITALDHILLDQKNTDTAFKNWFLPLNRKKDLQQIHAISEKYQMPVPWTEKIESLSVGIQQRIEILKILYNQAQLLILDEPTAVLTPQETEELFHQLLELKRQGKTIILITHKLKEVFQFADDVSVLRQGELIHSAPISQLTIPKAAELMVGHSLRFEYPQLAPFTDSQDLLEVKNLSLNGPYQNLKNISFQIKTGEILGIAGVEGNGQSELLQVLLRPQEYGPQIQGHILFQGKNILSCSTEEIRKLGISYLPEDRLLQAVLPDSAAWSNFLLGRQFESVFQNWGILKIKSLKEQATKNIKKYDVRPQNINLPLKNFSGGNQQKLVVARELSREPQFLIAAQPTRGVDIGAIEFIHDKMIELRNSGIGILLVSSDLDELMKLSDRMLVFYKGQIQGQLPRSEFEEKRIGCLMGGAR